MYELPAIHAVILPNGRFVVVGQVTQACVQDSLVNLKIGPIRATGNKECYVELSLSTRLW